MVLPSSRRTSRAYPRDRGLCLREVLAPRKSEEAEGFWSDKRGACGSSPKALLVVAELQQRALTACTSLAGNQPSP